MECRRRQINTLRSKPKRIASRWWGLFPRPLSRLRYYHAFFCFIRYFYRKSFAYFCSPIYFMCDCTNVSMRVLLFKLSSWPLFTDRVTWIETFYGISHYNWKWGWQREASRGERDATNENKHEWQPNTFLPHEITVSCFEHYM